MSKLLNVLVIMVSGAKENAQFLFENDPATQFDTESSLHVVIPGDKPTMIEVRPVETINFVNSKTKVRGRVTYWVALLPQDAGAYVGEIVLSVDAVGFASEQGSALLTAYGLDTVAVDDMSQMVQNGVAYEIAKAQEHKKRFAAMTGQGLVGPGGGPIDKRGIVVPN